LRLGRDALNLLAWQQSSYDLNSSGLSMQVAGTPLHQPIERLVEISLDSLLDEQGIWRFHGELRDEAQAREPHQSAPTHTRP
jgi:hypothetical protein